MRGKKTTLRSRRAFVGLALLGLVAAILPLRSADAAPAPGTITSAIGGPGRGPGPSVSVGGTGAFVKGQMLYTGHVNAVMATDLATGYTRAVAGNWRQNTVANSQLGDGGPALEATVWAYGVTVDFVGNLYISDGISHRIRRVTPGEDGVVNGGPGEVINTVVGTGQGGYSGDGGPAALAQVYSPMGMTADQAGNLYFVDHGNSRVRKVDVAGFISTVAGNGTACKPAVTPTCGDGGPAIAAAFNQPYDVGLDPAGNLVIADAYNFRVRYVNLGPAAASAYGVSVAPGNIATVAGNGQSPPGGPAGFPLQGDGGPANQAKVWPWKVTVDQAGNLFVSEIYRVAKVSPDGTLSTYAGDGLPCQPIAGYPNGDPTRFCGDGGPATQAHIMPGSVATDGAGNLYAMVTAYIAKVGTDGKITRLAGSGDWHGGDGGQAADAQLYTPSSVVPDGTGNLYFSDEWNNRVRKVDSTGVVTTVAGRASPLSGGYAGDGGSATEAALNHPQGVAPHPEGVVVADTGNNRVRFVNLGSAPVVAYGQTVAPGAIQTIAGTGELCDLAADPACGDGAPASQARLRAPYGVIVDAWGSLYLSDAGTRRIRKVNRAGVITTLVGTGEACPDAEATLTGPACGDGGQASAATLNVPDELAFDRDGNLFVADSYDYRIRRIDAKTKVITTVAGPGAADGLRGDGRAATLANLRKPVGVFIDGANNMFIADQNDHSVRKVVPGTDAKINGGSDEVITTVAGRLDAAGAFGQPGYSGDGGAATSAHLNTPRGVAVNAAGQLLVADSLNNRVRGVEGVATAPLPPLPARRAVADFDGDGATDIAVRRSSAGAWYAKYAAPSTWGIETDVPVPGDYDGDGMTDVAVYRPAAGAWYVQGGLTTQWGLGSDVPVPGDYDGDGTTDVAAYRPSTGAWYVQGGASTSWGIPGDVPVPGNYDTDPATEIAVYRPSTGAWYVQGGISAQWGIGGDVPIPGDYDGNGTTDVAVYRPSTGAWYVKDGAATSWGIGSDMPVPGDYNADGTTDVAVYRPATGAWYVKDQMATTWGIGGDVPLPLPAVIRQTFFPPQP